MYMPVGGRNKNLLLPRSVDEIFLKKNPPCRVDLEDSKRPCRERIGLTDLLDRLLAGSESLGSLWASKHPYSYRLLRIHVTSATAFHLSGKPCLRSATFKTVRKLSSRKRLTLALTKSTTSIFW